MRKMASIRTINSIEHIEGADAIECAVVGGWRVVIKKDEFMVGDDAVYCEIDSWIPHEIAPFLSKGKEPREYNRVSGERLRTVKLRGQVSQGLLLKINDFTHDIVVDGYKYRFCDVMWDEGEDVSEYLGIQKWEPPVPAQLAGEIFGVFPGVIPKTDQERIQNLTEELAEWRNSDLTWEVTEKMDGSSMTAYVQGDHFGVCSRNWELRETESNSFWRTARALDIESKLRSTGRNLAVQGELIGEGIQGNPYKIRGQDFRVFDVFDIDAQRYLTPFERRQLCQEIALDQVPLFNSAINRRIVETVDELLAMVECKSALNPQFEQEGVVFKCNEQELSFKVISNKFLLKKGE